MSLRTLALHMKKGSSKIPACMLMPTIARMCGQETQTCDTCLGGLTADVFLGS